MKRISTRRSLAMLSSVGPFIVGLLCLLRLQGQVLPPPGAPHDGTNKLASAARLFVREFQFEGNRTFSDEELSRVTEPFTGREISSAEVEEARRAVTLHYINQGYINSGATIPDQDPADGVILLHVVEGVLSGIDLSGNRWLRDSYIRGRVERWATPPLNMSRLQEGLQLLRDNPSVRQINAELKPGSAPGESHLDLRVVDQHPFRVGLQVDNQRPPSVGAEQIWALLSDLNLTGHSDVLDLKYGIANAGNSGFELSGVDNLEGSYFLPITRFDTTVGVQASRLNTTLFEEPFQALDITSLTTSYGLVLRQPVYQTATTEAALSVAFDHRRNETALLDQPFSLSRGAVDGEMNVSMLRLSQEWTQRGQDNVLALRSTFNFGLDILDATDNGIVGDPDGTSFSWLGQAQYIRRLFGTQNQLVLRVAGQWTDEPLLALEQFSAGGFDTVRGYLENQLVRDRGVVSSIEVRVPLLYNKAGAGILQIAPFFDFGGAWSINGSPDPTTISSVGSGLLYNPNKHISAQLYWGYRLRDVDMPDDAGAQGEGISFRVNIQAF